MIWSQIWSLNVAGVEALLLRLAGADQAGGVGDRRLQRLAGEEDQRRLEDGEHQREEGQGDEAELDRRRAALVAAETRATRASPQRPRRPAERQRLRQMPLRPNPLACGA